MRLTPLEGRRIIPVRLGISRRALHTQCLLDRVARARPRKRSSPRSQERRRKDSHCVSINYQKGCAKKEENDRIEERERWRWDVDCNRRRPVGRTFFGIDAQNGMARALTCMMLLWESSAASCCVFAEVEKVLRL